MKKIITTVGTSIFTNYFDEEDEKNIISKYKTITDKAKYKDWNEHDDEIQSLKKSVLNWAKESKDGSKISAEINSLERLKEDQKDEQIETYLLATETIEGRLAAEILNEYYEDKKDIRIHFNPEQDVVEGLQVKNAERFENVGIRNLFARMKDIVFDNNGKINNEDSLLNITGGYKGVIPYLSVFGQLYDIPVYYIYEESDKLIKAPNFPVQFDWREAELIYPYLSNIKSIYSNKEKEKQLKKQKLIYRENKELKITALGKLYKDYVDEYISIANNAFGLIIEFKMYEYYVEKIQNGDEFSYKFAKHSVDEDGFNSEEIDIVLCDNNDISKVKNFNAMEIKSFLHIYDKKPFGDSLYKLKKRLKSFKNKNKRPSEFYYIIYMNKKDAKDRLKEQAKKIKEEIKNIIPECIPKVFYLEVELTKKTYRNGKGYLNENEYQTFLQKGIKLDENFGEIKTD